MFCVYELFGFKEAHLMRTCSTALRFLSTALVLLIPASITLASYGIYVGKNLTGDGSVFLAGYGDEPSSHWLEIVPAQDHAPGEW